MIDNNRELIEFNHKNRDDHILIQGEFRERLCNFVDAIEDEHINRNGLIKYVVKKAFDLDDRDIILNKKKQIFIKLLKNTKRRDIVEHEPSEAHRFNGYSEDDFQDLYDEYFDSDKITEFLQMIAEEVFLDLFKSKQINNKYYEKNIYPVIQQTMAQELLEFIDKNLDFRKGFAGYIFRHNFLEVFEYISDELLYQVYLRNEYIMSWLKYYNGQIFVDNLKQYVSPELITDKNQKWNPVAIYGNVTVWFKTKDKIYKAKQTLERIDKTLKGLMLDEQTPVEYRKMLLEEKVDIKKFISESNITIQDKIEEKYGLKDAQKLAIIVAGKKDVEDISNEISAVNTDKKYKKLQEEKLKVEKDIKREEKALKQNHETYDSIQSALIKALVSKRTALLV